MPPVPEVIAPVDVVAYVLAGVAIILIAARIVGTIFEKIGQPRIVGEIVAGILIGPTIIGGQLAKAPLPGKPGVDGSGAVNDLFPIQSFAFLNLLGTIALVFYMFLVGMELDKRLLKGRGTQMLTMALAVTAIPVALGFLCGALLDSATWKPAGIDSTTFALFLGAGLSVTAFPVMARILQEKGMLGSQLGAIGVGSAAIVTVLMFLVIAAASASAKGAGIVDSVGNKFVLLIGLIAVLLLIARPLMGFVVNTFQKDKPIDGNLIALVLIGALATGLATDRILGAALVGGFLFGVAVPDKEGFAEAVIQKLEPAVILFFLPVFLAVSGLRTDLTLINGDLIGGIALFLTCMIVGKIGAGYIAGRAVGLSSRDAQAVGVLLNCRGLLILVVALIGLQLGVITPQMQVVFVLGAIVTTMMTGPLIDKILPQSYVKESTANLNVDDIREAQRTASGTAVIAG